MALNVGDTLGSYTINGVIGKGGMATVYAAQHNRLGRDVAIKVMHPALMQDDNFRARFEREARIVAGLEHPHVVSIYDFDEHEGQPYLTMRYVKGVTLKQHAIKHGLTPEDSADLLMALAEALDYAHSQGILHRDLKPSNVLIDMDGKPHLTDFGLARIAKAGESTMSQDMMLGTPYYISPEQAKGAGSVDHRTDIYSLGVMLYELITGQVPFTGDTPYAIVHGHIYETPAPPSSFNAELAPAVDAVLAKAMAKDPNQRYNSATEMIQAFRIALSSDDSLQHSAITPVDLPHWGANRTPTDSRKGVPGVKPTKTDKDGRPMRLEASFDMGRFDFSGLGKRIESGVENLAAMIEERIEGDFRPTGDPELDEERRIRRRIEKRIKARNDLVSHISWYLMVNGFLLFIWAMTGGGFPWPLFPIFFWGIGVVGNIADYHQKHGAGREKREAEIQRELDRERSRGQRRKLKNDALDMDDDGDDADWVMRQAGGHSARLNSEGEFTDSFAEEFHSDKRKKGSSRR